MNDEKENNTKKPQLIDSEKLSSNNDIIACALPNNCK